MAQSGISPTWTSQGGSQQYTSFSGLGVATLIYSGGPGRLNSYQVTNAIQSGFGVVFVDATVATSGMPFSTSGHKILGVIPGMNPTGAGASGIGYVVNPAAFAGALQVVNTQWLSGLVACPLASGGPSFTVSYNPATGLLNAD